jgi:tetratricopeptide (TPR) repeat protein
MAFVAAGARRLGADAAFVQFLLFLGGKLPGQTGRDDWPEVGPLARRVGRLDPAYARAYIYGASILAWYRNVDRPDEALDLLKEARAADPSNWTYVALEASIAFKKRSEFGAMADELAKVAREPDCPALVKSILANLYKAQGRYAQALALWRDIAVSKDGGQYAARARSEIPRLEALLRR